MKISGGHKVEDVNGIRCSVIEAQASSERAKFLEAILEHNSYQVLVQKNIPPLPKMKKTEGEETTTNIAIPETFKVGVTDITFNVAIMIFSRKLKTLENKILLPTYWNQKDLDYAGWYWKFKQ